MGLAIKLAGKGKGNTGPNPMVGAVIVKNGKIISSGYHRQAGLPHAETEAIKNSGQPLEGSTIYVTIEPCTFRGRTPPCVNEIIKHRFKEVVIGCIDPNPRVNGRGVEILKKAGIKTRTGLLEDKIKLQNEIFFKHIKTGVPFILCKIASSIDGKIAASASDSGWITSDKSRMKVQSIRKEYKCILTGINTVMSDNPYLFPRNNLENTSVKNSIRKFYRVVLDSSLKISLNSNIIRTSAMVKTIIFSKQKPSPGLAGKINKLKMADVDVLPVIKDPEGTTGLDILTVLKTLYKKYEITSILLECGPTLLTSFLKRNLIDKFIFFLAPKIIGGGGSFNMFGNLGIKKVAGCNILRFGNIKRVGDDIMVTAYPLKD